MEIIQDNMGMIKSLALSVLACLGREDVHIPLEDVNAEQVGHSVAGSRNGE